MDIVSLFNWTYVSTIASEGSYGESGIEVSEYVSEWMNSWMNEYMDKCVGGELSESMNKTGLMDG